MKLSFSVLLAVCAMSATANPSFNCDDAKHAVELSICESPTLSDLDADISKAYERLLASTDNQTELRQAQRQWLRETRNECVDADCLTHVMTERLSQLSLAMAGDPTQTQVVEETPQPPPAAQESTASDPIQEVSPPENAPAVAATEPVVQKSDETGLSLEMQLALLLGILAIMAVTAVGLSSYARYFVNWFDFSLTLGLTLVIAMSVNDDWLILAAVVLGNFLIGLAANKFHFGKGVVALIGRLTAIFTLLALAVACMVFIFTQMRMSSVSQRVNSGEHVRVAIMNDKNDQRRQAMAVAGSMGALGAVLYWIKTYFIDNAVRAPETS